MKKELIQKLGGNRAVAEALGVDRSAVGNWLLAKRDIPWKHKPAIARLAAEKAVALPPAFWENTKGEATSRLVAQRQPALYRIALSGPAKSEAFIAEYIPVK